MKKEHFLLVNIARYSSSKADQNYAIKLQNTPNDIKCIIEHTFKEGYQYVFQLWPCLVGFQEQIQIQIVKVDKERGKVSKISQAAPLVRYSAQGETYKFEDGKGQQKLMFNFKTTEKGVLRQTLEITQLKTMNRQMGKYLQTCKHELKNYQQFLSFTNNIIKQLNQEESPENLSSNNKRQNIKQRQTQNNHENQEILTNSVLQSKAIHNIQDELKLEKRSGSPLQIKFQTSEEISIIQDKQKREEKQQKQEQEEMKIRSRLGQSQRKQDSSIKKQEKKSQREKQFSRNKPYKEYSMSKSLKESTNNKILQTQKLSISSSSAQVRETKKSFVLPSEQKLSTLNKYPYLQLKSSPKMENFERQSTIRESQQYSDKDSQPPYRQKGFEEQIGKLQKSLLNLKKKTLKNSHKYRYLQQLSSPSASIETQKKYVDLQMSKDQLSNNDLTLQIRKRREKYSNRTEPILNSYDSPEQQIRQDRKDRSNNSKAASILQMQYQPMAVAQSSSTLQRQQEAPSTLQKQYVLPSALQKQSKFSIQPDRSQKAEIYPKREKQLKNHRVLEITQIVKPATPQSSTNAHHLALRTEPDSFPEPIYRHVGGKQISDLSIKQIAEIQNRKVSGDIIPINLETSILPSTHLNDSIGATTEPEINQNKILRRKRKVKSPARRQSSVTGTYHHIEHLERSSNANKQVASLIDRSVLYGISFWSFKATSFYNLYQSTPKRIMIQVQQNKYQTELKTSPSNLVEWGEKIVVKKISPGTPICLSLLLNIRKKTIVEGKSVVQLADLLQTKSSHFKVYLYQNDLALGFIEFAFQIGPLESDRRSSSLPQIDTRKKARNSTGIVQQQIGNQPSDIGRTKKISSYFDGDDNEPRMREEYTSRIKQMKKVLFPRVK